MSHATHHIDPPAYVVRPCAGRREVHKRESQNEQRERVHLERVRTSRRRARRKQDRGRMWRDDLEECNDDVERFGW